MESKKCVEEKGKHGIKNCICPQVLWLKSFSLYWIFIVMGIANTILGTSLVHLEKLMNVGEQTMSTVITFFALGYLIGSILCASMYDRLKPEFLFFAFNSVACVATIGAGLISSFPFFVTFVVIKGIGFGFNDSAGQSYGLRIWNKHQCRNSLIQAIHLCWSFGGIVGPFIIKPFLCEVNHSYENFNKTLNESEIVFEQDKILGNISTTCLDVIELATVRKAFIVVGLIVLSANIPFLIILLFNISKHKKLSLVRQKKNDVVIEDVTEEKIFLGKPDVQTNRIEQILHLKLILLTFVFVFGLLCYYIEGVTIAFITAFALKHLHWSVYQSSLILSIYFGAHFACRLLGVVVSAFLKPITILSITMTVATTAFLLMLAVNALPSILWVVVMLAGFGTGIIYPTNIIWVSENLLVTGKVSSVIVCGGSVGWITGPLIVGMLTSHYGQMCLVYFLVGSSSLFLILFILEALFIKVFGKKRHTSIIQNNILN
ncbi:hypothetical protein HELRODRAFT_182860 [Helobdella robusta]|uniref:Major facilitator superfamily (MFS) profile domain-containing protein n=1 Tax=Helobdella robusta TaxID=6412 RepID=T1FIV8_HELRO|nr:hypothetical protein HELRODRAFT_182860 [Helobdella robusta]ESN90068.1 hypothetical protein HELRODRAFT_182860 [Helobdella robusta]